MLISVEHDFIVMNRKVCVFPYMQGEDYPGSKFRNDYAVAMPEINGHRTTERLVRRSDLIICSCSPVFRNLYIGVQISEHRCIVLYTLVEMVVLRKSVACKGLRLLSVVRVPTGTDNAMYHWP